MAFGSSSVRTGGGSVADVTWRTNLGQFRADVTEAQRVYRRTTAQMSDSALKMAVAQEKLDRAISKFGAESRQAKAATLQYRSELRALEQQTERTDRELVQTQRHLDRLGRGALAGSGAFRGLGRSLAFASSSFLGGAGLVYGLRQAISAASDLHEQTTKTEAVFGAASKQVIAFANGALGQAKDQALDTASTIGALLHPIGIVGDQSAKVSIKLTQLGTDLASFYNSSVADALTAIRSGLVGETEPLRRYGVQLSAARVQAEALADSGKKNASELTNQEKILARVKIILHDTTQAQGDYARTIGGSANQERELQKNFRNTEILLGQTLQPAYRNLLASLNDYLGDAENQKRIQREVNDAVKVGGQIVRGLASGLKLVKAAAEPVIDALGGLEKAAQLALILGVVAKVRRAALSFALLQTSSRATATRGAADAAAFGRAWDIATRPRNMVVTTTGAPTGGRPVATPGGPAIPGKGGRFPKIPYVFGFNAPTIVAAAVVTAGGASGARTGAYDPKRYPRVAALLAQIENGQPLTEAQRGALAEFAGKAISELNAGELARLNANLAPQRTGVLGGDRGRPNQGRAASRPARGNAGTGEGGGGGGPRGNGLTRFHRLDLARQRAENTASLADDLRAAKDLLDYYADVASNTKLRGDKLYQARQDVLQQQGRVQAIEDRIASDRQQAQETAAAKRAAAAERLRKAREAARRDMEKRVKASEAALPGNTPYGNTSAKFAAGGVDPKDLVRKATAKSAASDEGPTLAEVSALFRGFLTDFTRIQSDFAANFSGGAGLNTVVLEQLTRKTNDHLERANLTRHHRSILELDQSAVMS